MYIFVQREIEMSVEISDELRDIILLLYDGNKEEIRPDRNEAEFAAWGKVYEILNRADEIFRSLFQEFIECDEARILQGEGVGEPIGILSQSDIAAFKEQGGRDGQTGN